MADTKQSIYDELCRVLTDYESNCSEDGASADALYDMLVKIQNRWEDVITRCEVDLADLSEKLGHAATCKHFNPRKPSARNCDADEYAPFNCESCNRYEKADYTKHCKLCGCKMVWEHSDLPGRWLASSCYLEDWPICHSCMVEHCCSTKCLGCEYGKYPNCRFLSMKEHYMGDD